LLLLGLTGVCLALLVGGVSLFAVLTMTMNRTVAEEARSSARQTAEAVSQGRLPQPIPVSGAQVVQVLDHDNRVLGGSASADRLTPLISVPERVRVEAGEAITVPGSRAAITGELTVAGAAASGAGGVDVLVVAAVPTADLETSRRIFARMLFVFFPLVAAVLGVVAWRMIGSTLQPVEQLRVGAERIGDSTTEARLPVPPTSDEIAALATTLNGMLDRLASARAKQREFVADAAHELRSPLASMRTQVEVAARLGEDGGLADGLLAEIDRLSALVEDLLVLARAADQNRPDLREPVDLAALVTEVAERYRGARVPVVVGATSQPHVPLVSAAPAELLRAVTNLVDNAVRHARTRVSLSVTSAGGSGGTGGAGRAGGTGGAGVGVTLCVTDDGTGIAPSDRERVFDRFARLDEARARDTGGSGLGLAITRDLLHRNGARITLEDADPGVRAVVTLRTGDSAG
jgi:signal transduction histidine kinase